MSVHMGLRMYTQTHTHCTFVLHMFNSTTFYRITVFQYPINLLLQPVKFTRTMLAEIIRASRCSAHADADSAG